MERGDDGRSSSADRNYGIALFFWNSDHKIENNILRHHRHSLSSEGGGAGCVYLYNYVDDNFTDDLSYLGSSRTTHGAHPMMNLYEGNWVSHLTADRIWGSSSHIVLYRNWLRGAQSGIGVPGYPTTPNWAFIAADIWRDQKYYSLVGNVLRVPSWSGGAVRNSLGCNPAEPTAYLYACDSSGIYDPATFSSILSHGNYDYISDGVAYWDGGTAHQMRPSMYYGSKPAFFGGCAWPVYGPDLSPITRTLPAKARFDGGSACGVVTPAPPSAPTNLRILG